MEQENVMVMQPTYGSGFIESPTIEMSQEGLRSILNQIEAELQDSEVYRRTMAGLQTMLGEASNTAQILVKAVGREAVRLTFQQFARRYNIIPLTSEGTNEVRQEEFDSHPIVEEQPMQTEVDSDVTFEQEETIDSGETTQTPSQSRKPTGENKPPKKLTKAELAAEKAAKEREEIIRQVGQELMRVREARSLSVDQLHRQTLVPLHHIEALEAGHVNLLPEDVYVRGFIRRMGCALGLDGVAIAASIPEPDPVKSVVPSWYISDAVPGFQLKSVHLYLGYTALIAGAIGGLGLMSEYATPGVSVEPEPTSPPKASTSPKTERKNTTSKPGIKSSKTGIKAGADIAPPEALSF